MDRFTTACLTDARRQFDRVRSTWADRQSMIKFHDKVLALSAQYKKLPEHLRLLEENPANIEKALATLVRKADGMRFILTQLQGEKERMDVDFDAFAIRAFIEVLNEELPPERQFQFEPTVAPRDVERVLTAFEAADVDPPPGEKLIRKALAG